MLNNVQNSRNLGKIKRCSKTGPKGSYIFCTGSTLREADERWTVKFSVLLPQLEIICTVPPSKPFGFPACFFSYRTELSCRKDALAVSSRTSSTPLFIGCPACLLFVPVRLLLTKYLSGFIFLLYRPDFSLGKLPWLPPPSRTGPTFLDGILRYCSVLTAQASSFSCTGPTSPLESYPGCLLLVPVRLLLSEKMLRLSPLLSVRAAVSDELSPREQC